MSDKSKFDSIMYITDRPDIVMTGGRGMRLVDDSGREYLDFIQGWAVNCLGHCPELVINALEKQARKLINPSPAYYNAPMVELADLICQNSCFDKVFFANSGAEANEGAIKLARKWGALNRNGAYEIISMDNSFHGRTLATMSLSGKATFQDMYEPKVPGFVKVPFADMQAVKNAAGDKTVAVMLEPVQGEAGVYPADEKFMAELADFCRQNGILLIVDEVQTGYGRTGKLFAYQNYGITPDIMTLGKGMGAGVPLAALVATEKVACFAAGEQGGTYNGNPLMCAVGCAVIKEVSSEAFLTRVNQASDYLREGLEKLSEKYALGCVRGKGLLLALDLNRSIGAQVIKAAMSQGLLLNSPQPDTLRFMPALNVENADIDQMIDVLDGVLEQIK